MRNLKRLLTMVMAIAMLMSLMVVGTGAAFKDQDKIENTDAVNMNVALNIINGRDDGTFDPAGNVTRAEMAKMICVLLNGGNAPTLATKPIPVFTDIKGHWGEKYIEYCASLGIIAGMGDGTFVPDGKVTGTQAAKMLLVALGYDAAFEGFNGASWSVKINVAANQKNLYEDISIDPNAALCRDDAAQMVWNALQALEVKYNYSLTTVNGQLQNVQAREDKTTSLLQSKYKAVSDYASVMTAYKWNDTDKKFVYTMADGKQFKTADDFTALFGMNTKVVYKGTAGTSATVYGMYAEDSTVLASGVFGKDLDVADYNTADKTIKINGTKYKYDLKSTDAGNADKLVAFAANAYDTTGILTAANFANNNTFNYAAIDVDDNGKIDWIVVTPYTVDKVTYVGKTTLTLATGGSLKLDDINAYEGVQKDDFVQVIAAANTADNTLTLQKVEKVLAGKVSAISGGKYTIDGTAYKLAGAAVAKAPAVGDSIKSAPVVNGYIFDLDASGTTAVEEYALVIGTESASGFTGAQAKLLFSDGTKKIVDTDLDYNAAPNAIADNTMVTYSVNSDKEYELKVVDFTSTTGTGYDTAYTAAKTNGVDVVGGNKITNSDGGTATGKVKYIAGANVADTAVIFVQSNTDTYEVITGAKLLTLGVADMTLVGAYADDASNGFSSVKVAFITNTNKLITGSSNYGYVVADPAQVKNTDGKVVYEYTIWNGTKNVTVQAKFALTDANTIVKGDVLTYTINTESKMDSFTRYPLAAGATIKALTANDGTYVLFDGDANRYELDKDDTTILYINAADKVGVEGASIQVATKKPVAGYYENVLLLDTNADKTIDLLVVDVNNDILNAQ